MERDRRRRLQIAIDGDADGVLGVVNQAEWRNRTGLQAEMLHQPLGRPETELPVADLSGYRPQIRALLILKDDDVVPRPLLVPHEQILAVRGVDAGPVLLEI